MTDASQSSSAQSTSKTHAFQAEVAKLLHLMVHSVYSEREVFLRELISNGSDACDKLRYRTVVEPDLVAGDPNFRIVLRVDPARKCLYVQDNGIGMSHDDMVENLGTIARSGTSEFVRSLEPEDVKQNPMIGQFGVGFYSAFMVADNVSVVSRRIGAEEVWRWSSDGGGAFDIEACDSADALLDGRGTSICVHLKDDAKEFLETDRLRRIVKDYSDHIAFPIYLADTADAEPEQINRAGALWMRPKSEISEDQYKEFYHHVGQAFDEPSLTIHYKAEGRHEYSVLLFVPSERPMDLFDPKRSTRVKLYVKRVYITDDADLVPGYLRFVRGVIDSEDMPLNLSREMLQNNPLVANIRGAVTKRILSELAKLKEKDLETFDRVWDGFGAVVKEGLYEDFERRDQILEICRFRSTAGEGWRSLEDYKADMKDTQTAIYFLRGDDPDALRISPQLEGFRARGLEVLLLSDPIDSFWTSSVDAFKGSPLKSVSNALDDLGQFELLAQKGEEADDRPDDKAIGTLIAAFKQALEGKVADVRRSDRLTESPVCLVAEGGMLDPYMERILAQRHGADPDPLKGRILEINPTHGLIKRLCERVRDDGISPEVENAAYVLLEQARILEGEPVLDAGAFSRKLVDLISRTF